MIFTVLKQKEAHSYLDDLFWQRKKVSIKIYREKRSISQNNLMWLWFTCIEHETGNDRQWVHDYYCQRHLPPKEEQIKMPKGIKIIYVMQGTSDLDTLRMTIFLDKVKMDAEEEFTTDKEKPFLLPLPADKHFKEFVEFYSQYL